MSTEAEPRRGEIWIVQFGPSVGGEIQKTRPAIVVSNDFSNNLLNRVQVVPISSRTGQVYSGECLIMVAGDQRKAIADQITTVSKQRLLRRIGPMAESDLDTLARVMRAQLAL